MTHHWGYVSAVSAAILFGVNAALSKLILVDVHPLTAAGLTYFVAGIALLLVRLSPLQKAVLSLFETPTKTETEISRRDYAVLSAVILFGSVVAPLSYFYGLGQTTAINTSLLLNAEALFTASIAFIFLGERGTRKDYAGLLLLLVGAIFLTTNGELQKATLSTEVWGNLLVVGACFFWSLDNTLSSLLSRKRDLVLLTALKCFVGGGIVLASSVALGFDYEIPLAAVPYILSVGAFSIGFSILLFLVGLREIGAMKTGVIFSTSSLFGVAFAFLILGESVTLLQLIAGLVMLTGVYVMSKKQTQK